MKIKQINSQHRRDFRADYECEHCGKTADTEYHKRIKKWTQRLLEN